MLFDALLSIVFLSLFSALALVLGVPFSFKLLFVCSLFWILLFVAVSSLLESSLSSFLELSMADVVD